MFCLIFYFMLSQEKWMYKETVLNTKSNEGAIKFLASKKDSVYGFGMDLIELHNDPDQAINWFSRFAKDPESEVSKYAFFGRAWAHWIKENYHYALQDSFYLLQQKNLDPLLKARCNYLLGLIQTFYREFDLAEKCYKKSIEIYKTLDRKWGMLMGTVELANCQIQVGNYFAATKTLKEIKTTNPKYLGRINELFGEIEFRKGNFIAATQIYSKSLKDYQENSNLINEAYIQSKRGLCYALSNNFSEAHNDARDVDYFANKNNQKTLFHYNNLTWIFLNKCRGLPIEQYVIEIKNWSNANSDKELENLKNMILALPCP